MSGLSAVGVGSLAAAAAGTLASIYRQRGGDDRGFVVDADFPEEDVASRRSSLTMRRPAATRSSPASCRSRRSGRRSFRW
jgi:hypothetical protein